MFRRVKEAAIPLENAGSSLAEWVKRARVEQTTFVVVDAAKPVARLVPAEQQRCSGAELAGALAHAELTADEARAWAEDLRKSREALAPPEDRWR
jgi:antitoxin (DNA-binding transcriptional repressor) of toxin-antitoxin stability system